MTGLLVVSAGTTGYAAWHGDDADRDLATARQQAQRPAGGSTRSRPAGSGTQQTPEATATSPGTGPGARPSGAKGFASVVTDRIPAPTTSLPLSAAIPGTTNMQAPAAAAFERAFAAERAVGLTPEVRSAWRSEQWQQVLFDRAVAKYGSRAEAGKWVLPPLKSAHVKGYAVDVHPQSAAGWLEEHGAAYGLCRTYDNEWWHFEYLATSTCPPRLPTAAG